MTKKHESRSVQRRKALQRGEPMPTFEKQETLRELLAFLDTESKHVRPDECGTSLRVRQLETLKCRLAPIVERMERASVRLGDIAIRSDISIHASELLSDLYAEVEREVLGRKD